MAIPLSLTKQATKDNLALFLSLVDVLAERHALHQRSQVDLRLLAEEACTNVVLHAFGDDEPGEMTLSVGCDDDVAEIVIEDDGQPFDPSGTPGPSLSADWQERPVGGLGWHLIRNLSDDVRYERVGERNRLTLRKRVEFA
jgi:anti-sigma regulatory factor (Ser/Thr protein kinase)